MKKHLLKIVNLIICIILTFSSIFAIPSQAAENDFSMESFDKGYITFLFDDGRMPFTKECFELFKGYNMPICCALVANRASSNLDLFLQIQKSGGEILSHSYSHNALTSTTSTKENIEKELGDAFRVLTGLGFNINGIVEVGNGGGEKTANYELIETISRKYYKYSNAYGVSPQYNMDRTTLSGKPSSTAKSYIYDAVTNKQWKMLWMHDFSEFSKADMIELLDYIKSFGKDKVEVVTWNYIYENFGNYTGPQVPTKEAIESVCATQGHNIKNGTVIKEATCENGPVMKGVCDRCGKNGTSQSKDGALDHKFGTYVSDNNADCSNLATKTAKCTRKGCNATNTIEDTNSKFKHNFKTITVKKATDTTDGIAEVKCSLCGYVEKAVTIPKGKDAKDVVSSKPEKNNTSTSNKNDASNTIGSINQEQNSSNNETSSTVDSSVQEGTNSDTSSNAPENNTQKTNKSNTASDNSTGLTIVWIVVSALLVVSIVVFVFLLIKFLRT